jgi:hypothetical protein
MYRVLKIIICKKVNNACKVNGNKNVKEWTRVHSSLEVSLHKINNMLGK